MSGLCMDKILRYMRRYDVGFHEAAAALGNRGARRRQAQARRRRAEAQAARGRAMQLELGIEEQSQPPEAYDYDL